MRSQHQTFIRVRSVSRYTNDQSPIGMNEMRPVKMGSEFLF